MKKRNTYFILLNILCTLIEYILIFMFLYKVIQLKLLLSILIPVVVLIVNMFLSKIFTKNIFKDVTITDEKKINKYQDIVKPFIKYVKDNLNINIKIEYVDLEIRPNPAWCINDTIYINIAYAQANNELLGMCSHEVGHLYSGLSKHIYLYYFRLTSILSLIINLFIKLICMIVDKNMFLKILGTVIYVPLYISYVTINIFNHFVINPFLRKDELIANDIAIKLGYGNELLYYYKLIKYYEDSYAIKLQRLVDFEHPNVDKMINLMVYQINNQNINNGYIIYNKTLMLCDNQEEVLNIPHNALIIDYNAFLFKDNVKEIHSDTLEKIETFKHLKKLVRIYAPNLKKFPLNIFNICSDLTTIEINNEEGKYLLGLSYLRVNNQEKAQLTFEQNMSHKASLKELLKIYTKEELILYVHHRLADLKDIPSIKYLINYYEQKEQYDIAMIYIDKISDTLTSFANYKKGTYCYYGFGTEKNIQLAKAYLILSTEKEAQELLEIINKGENPERMENN